jgi:hypothetical protein
MMYQTKVAVCSKIRTQHWTQNEPHTACLNVVVRQETAGLSKVEDSWWLGELAEKCSLINLYSKAVDDR